MLMSKSEFRETNVICLVSPMTYWSMCCMESILIFCRFWSYTNIIIYIILFVWDLPSLRVWGCTSSLVFRLIMFCFTHTYLIVIHVAGTANIVVVSFLFFSDSALLDSVFLYLYMIQVNKCQLSTTKHNSINRK